jgi:hypothetical protein
LPTENTRDATAPPISPVTGSKPRMENVPGVSGGCCAGFCANIASGSMSMATKTIDSLRISQILS